MALEYNYTTLVADLASWPEETDPQFVTEIPTLIQHGELRLLRELALTIFETTATANITSASAAVTKPANMVSPLDLFYTLAGEEIHLTRATREFVRAYNAQGATGSPRYYAEESETTWLLAPKPNFTQSAGLTCVIIRRPAGLSSGSPSTKTWLSTYVPDLLLDSCLLAAERFLKNDARWATVKRDFDLKVSDAKAELAQLRRVMTDDQLINREVVRPANSDAPSQSE